MSKNELISKKGWQTKWSKQEESLLKENYSKMPIEELLKMFPSRTKMGIQQHAFKLGLKYLYYNKDYFENIDNEEKAYWLGFIYADGCITTQDRFAIGLAKVDSKHLEKFAKCIESNIRIKYGITKKKDTTYVKTKSDIESCSITIKNSKFVKDLKDKGVVRNKTYLLKFPEENILPRKFIKDFVRGYMDGDGCYVFLRKDRVRKDRDGKVYSRITKEISATGYCEEFMIQMSDVIKDECGAEFKLYYNPKGKMPTIRMFNKENMKKFLEYIYYDGCICLDRKYEKAREILYYCLA